MIPTLVLVAALVAAMVAMGARRLRRSRLRRLARSRPGATAETAIAVRSFTEMDEHLARRWCACGGFLERRGEGTRGLGARRLRVARLACQECEAEEAVYFDTTDLLH